MKMETAQRICVQMFLGNVTHPDITKVAGMAGAHGNSSVGKIELVLELDTVAPHADP